MTPNGFDPLSRALEALAVTRPAEPIAPQEPPTVEEWRIADRDHAIDEAAELAGFGPHIDENGPFADGYRILVGKAAAGQLWQLGVGSVEFLDAFRNSLARIAKNPMGIPMRRVGSEVRECACTIDIATRLIRFTVDADARVVLVIHVES